MDEILDDLVRAARRCERATRQLEVNDVIAIRDRLAKAIGRAALAWSGSWIGYQANVYKRDLEPRRPGESFDSEWGSFGSGFVNTTRGDWFEYDLFAVMKHVSELAEVSDDDWGRVESAAADVAEIFVSAKAEILPTLDAVLAVHDDKAIRSVRDEIAKLESHHAMRDLAFALAPNQVMSRDPRAMQGGLQVPPHIQVHARLAEQLSYGSQVAELGTKIRYVSTYLQKRHNMGSPDASVGHPRPGSGGQSPPSLSMASAMSGA